MKKIVIILLKINALLLTMIFVFCVPLQDIIQKFNPGAIGASLSRNKRVFNKAVSGAKAEYVAVQIKILFLLNLDYYMKHL